MGDRYFISVRCTKCGVFADDVYYAPTCGFIDHKCECGEVIDLEKYTGISAEEASNIDTINEICRRAKEGK
jgi:hypothetical protein